MTYINPLCASDVYQPLSDNDVHYIIYILPHLKLCLTDANHHIQMIYNST